MKPANRTPADIESRVMELSAKGVNNRRIAYQLGIGESSVRRIKERSAKEETETTFVTLAKSRQARVKAGFQELPGKKADDFYAEDVPNVPPSDKVLRILAIGDAHDDPTLDKRRFRWIGKHAVEMQPDHIVQIGDIADFESLSFHSGNETNNGKYKPRFMADIESLNQGLEEMFTPMNKGRVNARLDITLGNHENRIWRFEDAAPETVGMLQRDLFELFAEYGIFAHQYGKYIDIGGVKFTHSPFSVMGRPIGGVTAGQTIARQTGSDMVYGHTHKAGVVTHPRIGGESKVTVIDLGCALPQGHVAPYAKHTLTGWSWGVWELIVQYGSIQGYNFLPMSELERRYR